MNTPNMSDGDIPESMLDRALDAFYGSERDKRSGVLTRKKRRQLMKEVLRAALGDEFFIMTVTPSFPRPDGGVDK